MKVVRAIACICLLAAAIAAAPQTFEVANVPKEVIQARLADAPRKDDERKQKMQQLFRDAGCAPDAMEEQKVSGEHLPNIICTVKGTGDERIVVGGHYDYVHEGAGIVDNWSGASLLPSLMSGISSKPRQHTYVFIAFSGEEHGLVGSHYYVNHLSKQERATIRAMVNLDTLGLAPTEIWLSHADKDLARDLAMLATSMHLPLFQMNVEAVGSSDSESFREKKIPSLTLHSVTPSNFKILHTSRDRLAEIHEDDYYTSYKLINAYVTFLDQAVAAPAAKPQ